ncbi:helix-turn-helix domain-containing protein [Tenacibaculum maritimum]|uniref:helix-turn-helix domain-containing protein n=1 Tax=Tenacibaculum maritimum TaxID=107401 RepID=UPI001E4D4547|nr:helix-turn-helix transcriptional regulator [Tenacibaculum maritimum]MCD9563400.1 helix-turn-helix transcriptional regulator [Tenacibaculum maritimum]MCD9566968.1 helix-turn-helix transcriptional regulator [Tenacibaculum maritimum]MCD9579641.1 helix-turn-helix transcriptional regulator [Tenacibaculum maritimum]MCD9597019.1 helix-turn-helix transcriptional regulator [Tenacibaculum maritimum]MCD9614095.1 helix-turn-helix transcriptional regulator [Tenacibaculum maritimum]
MDKRTRKREIPEFCIELGKHIRKLRNEKKISIEEIAFKADIDAQNLRKYELGKQEMKISMLKRIADAFSISPSELLNFEEEN